MTLSEISSAVFNDLFGGAMIPPSNRSLISLEQLEDEAIEIRKSIIKEFYHRNMLSFNDIAYSINCIEIDCKDMNMCPCKSLPGKIAQHFEIPRLLDGLGNNAILFIGSVDRSVSYKVYNSISTANYQIYKKRSSTKPYVYINRTPNENGMLDGWIMNAPFVKYISITAIFADPRDLEGFNCCQSEQYLEMGSLSHEIIRRMLVNKTQLYRTIVPPASQLTS